MDNMDGSRSPCDGASFSFGIRWASSPGARNTAAPRNPYGPWTRGTYPLKGEHETSAEVGVPLYPDGSISGICTLLADWPSLE